MIRKYILASLMTVSCIINAQAQSPQKMSYQAVIRTSDNQLVINRTVRMRISLLPDSMNAMTSYVETHQVTTNILGVVQLEIGGGTVVSGSFAAIPWSRGKMFIKTETDPAGGTNYTLTSTTQLMSVPYATYTNDLPVSKKGDTVTIGTTQLIIPGATLLPNAVATPNLSVGLVAYYPFNGNANDESGNANHGNVNGPNLTMDRFGNQNKSYQFNGSGDYIEVPDHATLRPSQITLSAWIKRGSLTGSILGKTNFPNASNEQYALHIVSGKPLLSIKQNSNCSPGNGWYMSNQEESNESNNWQHIAGTFDGKLLKIYLDGKLKKSVLRPVDKVDSCVGGNLQIGRWWSGDRMYFSGSIDDIRIYNRALTEEEILILANN